MSTIKANVRTYTPQTKLPGKDAKEPDVAGKKREPVFRLEELRPSTRKEKKK